MWIAPTAKKVSVLSITYVKMCAKFGMWETRNRVCIFPCSLTPRAVLVDGHDSLVSNHSFGHVFLLICKQYLLVRNLSQRRQLVGAVSNRIGASHYRFDCPVKFTGLFPYRGIIQNKQISTDSWISNSNLPLCLLAGKQCGSETERRVQFLSLPYQASWCYFQWLYICLD